MDGIRTEGDGSHTFIGMTIEYYENRIKVREPPAPTQAGREVIELCKRLAVRTGQKEISVEFIVNTPCEPTDSRIKI